MSVSYTPEQERRAKRDGLHLVTIDACGLCWQGPVPARERERLRAALRQMLDRLCRDLRRREAARGTANGHARPAGRPGVTGTLVAAATTAAAGARKSQRGRGPRTAAPPARGVRRASHNGR